MVFLIVACEFARPVGRVRVSLRETLRRGPLSLVVGVRAFVGVRALLSNGHTSLGSELYFRTDTRACPRSHHHWEVRTETGGNLLAPVIVQSRALHGFAPWARQRPASSLPPGRTLNLAGQSNRCIGQLVSSTSANAPPSGASWVCVRHAHILSSL
jgi:hypothetical protein